MKLGLIMNVEKTESVLLIGHKPVHNNNKNEALT